MHKFIFFFFTVFMSFAGCKVDKLTMADNMVKYRRYDSARKWARAELNQKEIVQSRKLKLQLILSLCSLREGYLKSAEDYLLTILNSSKNNYKALFLLGVIRIRENRLNDAQDFFSKATRCYWLFNAADHHLNESFEYSILLFNEMMCYLATKNTNAGYSICDILLSDSKTPLNILSWCKSVRDETFSLENNAWDSRVARGTNWRAALVYYYRVPLLKTKLTQEQLIVKWIEIIKNDESNSCYPN